MYEVSSLFWFVEHVSKIWPPISETPGIKKVYECDIEIYIQQDEALHSLFYLETALHVSGGTTTHHQERKQLYLQHLVFVRPLLLPAAISGRWQ